VDSLFPLADQHVSSSTWFVSVLKARLLSVELYSHVKKSAFGFPGIVRPSYTRVSFPAKARGSFAGGHGMVLQGSLLDRAVSFTECTASCKVRTYAVTSLLRPRR
jgi:hypothetical protein